MKRLLFDYCRKFLIGRSLKSQALSPLQDLSLWGLATGVDGFVSVNGTSCADLAREYGSPLLVVNRKQLRADAASIVTATRRCGRDSRVLYSYKTNCVPGILQELHRGGVGAEVVSPYELWLAGKLGVPGDEIVYNGVNKTEESIARAVELGILAINVDALPEIELITSVARRVGRKARVGIRLGFLEKAQFGLDIESGEAMEACRRIAGLSDVLEMTCIHFCVASNIKNSITHAQYATRALHFIYEVKQETGLSVRYLDLGGGIGVPTTKNMTGTEYGLYRLFGCLPAPPDPGAYEAIDSFVSAIDTTVRNLCTELHLEPPGLIFEPGRFVTSRAEFLLSTVLALKNKSSGATFAITDAGRLSTTFPCEFEYHEIFTADLRARRKKGVYHIMGRICTSADWMAKNRFLPELREGDILVTMDAGAYFSSYSTNFAFPRPAIVMVGEDGGSEVIRHAESFEHLTRLDAGLTRQGGATGPDS